MASLSALSGVLQTRNARLFYSGSVVCWTGSWVQRIATDWLAWELTHSAFWVGVLAFATLIPSIVVSPFAGAIADRMDRVKLVITSELVAASQAAALVALVLTGTIRIEIMAALAFINGAAETFAQPARQCLLPGLVQRQYLPGAVALNSLTYNIARFIGPALSGPMIVIWGVVPSIAVNAFAFLYAAMTMLWLRLDPAIRRGQFSSHSVLHDAIEGLRYAARHRGIGPLLLFAATVGMTMRSIPEMLPPFVAQQFGRGAEGLATLASCMGVAAMLAGFWVAIRGRVEGLTQVALIACGCLAAGCTLFVATGSFEVGVIAIIVMGASTPSHGIAIQTLLQNSASPAMVGRVLGLWGMITRAAPAIGALVYGTAAEFAGLQAPVLVGIALCMLMWLRTWARRKDIADALER
ncbi:MAG: MFS transporter [Acetobacteraceae bacterium]